MRLTFWFSAPRREGLRLVGIKQTQQLREALGHQHSRVQGAEMLRQGSAANETEVGTGDNIPICPCKDR